MRDKKEHWLFFFRDPELGTIHSAGYGHNAIGDYRGNPYFIGSMKIEFDEKTLSK